MTKYFLPLVLLAPSAFAQGKTWAVVVGIDEYVRPAIPKLRYAVADAKLFARALQDTMKIPTDNIFLMTSDSVDENAQPRLTNVAFRLGWLSEKAQKEDTIIFYFAGHGMTVDGQPFLLTEESDNRSGSTLKVSALSGADVIGTLRKPAIANVWVVLDACRNSPSGKGEVRLDDTLSGSFSHADVGRERTATMFACKVGERSWEWDEVKHGCYTYFLVDGLRREAADPEGRVTMQGLSNFVNEQVPKATQKLGTSQNPRLFYGGAGPDQWVLAQVPAAAQKDPKKRPADIANYVAQLEILQAKLDRETALRVAAEQKARSEESRRLELEQRLAVMEKQVSGTAGLSGPKSEPKLMAYAERGLQDGALELEVKRLQEENRSLNQRLSDLQSNLAKLGMVSRDVKLVEEQSLEASLLASSPADPLKLCLQIRDCQGRQLQRLESAYGDPLNARQLPKSVAT
ncbi:caspase family protein, partial [bacterium]|nr:caspase family protein [bacterium]